MMVMRHRDVPVRTTDGGKTWSPLESVRSIAGYGIYAEWSWTGKTLALSSVVGRTLVWVSRDDGDTWVDESADYTAMSGGLAQWFEGTLYISSMGQGIAAKVLEQDEPSESRERRVDRSP